MLLRTIAFPIVHVVYSNSCFTNAKSYGVDNINNFNAHFLSVELIVLTVLDTIVKKVLRLCLTYRHV